VPVEAGDRRQAPAGSPPPLIPRASGREPLDDVWSSSTAGVVTFYLPDQGALNDIEPEDLDCDRDWEVFGTGVHVWVLQTYVRLRAGGAPVRLAGTAPASGVVVTHSDYVERLLRDSPSARDLTVVSARADRPPQIYADVEIVQNAAAVRDYQIFIPSWLQPGLVPRRRDRAARIERIAYIGAHKQLHPDIAADEWAKTLRSRGLQWDLRAITFAGNDRLYTGHRWNDYADVDVLVALRPPATWTATTKPAAKLTNAWAAGVPAVLSPEVQYAELRRSPLDYLEARDGLEALGAIERLRRDPELYAAMVRNGLARAREFESARVAARWAETLWRVVPIRTCGAAYRFAARYRGYRAQARRALAAFQNSRK
jgi:hypothetical protein